MDFVILVLVVFGLVAFIPYAIGFYTKSEVEDREFRELFYRESGHRAFRIVCTVGCFYPISFFARLPDGFESWMFMLVVCSICFVIHAQLYLGVNVMISRRWKILISLVCSLVVVHLINKFGYISVYIAAFVSATSALCWGWYICLVRSRIIAAHLGLKIGGVA